jgi:hypothetical protein
MFKSNEELAKELGASPKELRDEFRYVMSVMSDYWRTYFKKTTYDFKLKQLRGSDGYVLQWQTRRYPDLPETYDNQQTSKGIVLLLKDGEDF